VLLSLVRTRAVGHMRDPRRLTVALSRARLGLYVFGRRSVFEPIPELAPAFGPLFARPTNLCLLPLPERHPCFRPSSELLAACGLPPPPKLEVDSLERMAGVVRTLMDAANFQAALYEQRVREIAAAEAAEAAKAAAEAAADADAAATAAAAAAAAASDAAFDGELEIERDMRLRAGALEADELRRAGVGLTAAEMGADADAETESETESEDDEHDDGRGGDEEEKA
jgi:intron-binding protein aquarius